jgi:hypothetical protein
MAKKNLQICRVVIGLLLLGGHVDLRSEAVPGLVGEYYQNFKVADGKIVFDGLTLVKTQVDTNWHNWNGSPYYHWDPIGGGNYSVRWSGAFWAEESGEYGFGTISDDGSQIWLDGRLVLDNGEPQWYDWQESYVHLNRGYHSIEITYYDSGVYSGIEVWWRFPAAEPSVIPYTGEDFHAVPPVFNPETNWSLASSEFLSTTPPVPFPVIGIEVVQENGQVELGWASATEATYRLQSSPDLESWLDVAGPVPGTGELMQHAVSAQQRQEFFRVLAEPVSDSPAP